MLRRPQRPPLFPYTTLFRSAGKDRCCPVGCSAADDVDCAACGDGVIDQTSGETCDPPGSCPTADSRSEEHTSELQSQSNLVCRLLLEKKKNSSCKTPLMPMS